VKKVLRGAIFAMGSTIVFGEACKAATAPITFAPEHVDSGLRSISETESRTTMKILKPALFVAASTAVLYASYIAINALTVHEKEPPVHEEEPPVHEEEQRWVSVLPHNGPGFVLQTAQDTYF
jgi:hypothetical protein